MIKGIKYKMRSNVMYEFDDGDRDKENREVVFGSPRLICTIRSKVNSSASLTL